MVRKKPTMVLVVPALAQAPPSLLANVFVFKNGVRGGRPFKYQPDVFDNPPGSEGYRPLRALALVTWKNEQAARVLKSERADGMGVLAPLRAAPEPGVYRGEVLFTMEGPWELRVRVARQGRRFELPFREQVTR